MSVECIIRVDSERVSIQIPQDNYSFQAPNLVGWDRVTRKIVSFGSTEGDLRQRAGAEWSSFEKRIELMPAFSSTRTDPDFDVTVLRFYLSSAAYKSSRLPVLLQFTFPQYDYILSIPEYEHFSQERKERLQYSLQTQLAAHTLSINGRSVGIPVWKRSFEGIVNFFLAWVMPLLSIRYLAVFAPREFDRFVLFIFLVFTLIPAIAIAGSAIWMVTMQMLVPKSYLKYRAQSLNGIGVRRLSSWLLA